MSIVWRLEAQSRRTSVMASSWFVSRNDVRTHDPQNVNDQIAYAHQVLSADPKLAGGFNAIGFSQGAPSSLARTHCNRRPVPSCLRREIQQPACPYPHLCGRSASRCASPPSWSSLLFAQACSGSLGAPEITARSAMRSASSSTLASTSRWCRITSSRPSASPLSLPPFPHARR